MDQQLVSSAHDDAQTLTARKVGAIVTALITTTMVRAYLIIVRLVTVVFAAGHPVRTLRARVRGLLRRDSVHEFGLWRRESRVKLSLVDVLYQ
jgi:hypothetical protein